MKYVVFQIYPDDNSTYNGKVFKTLSDAERYADAVSVVDRPGFLAVIDKAYVTEHKKYVKLVQ